MTHLLGSTLGIYVFSPSKLILVIHSLGSLGCVFPCSLGRQAWAIVKVCWREFPDRWSRWGGSWWNTRKKRHFPDSCVVKICVHQACIINCSQCIHGIIYVCMYVLYLILKIARQSYMIQMYIYSQIQLHDIGFRKQNQRFNGHNEMSIVEPNTEPHPISR